VLLGVFSPLVLVALDRVRREWPKFHAPGTYVRAVRVNSDEGSLDGG